MGWTFSRVRSTEFFRNPDRALKPIFEKLQALEIVPQTTKSFKTDVLKGSSDLVDRIVRRAEKLRSSWTNNELSDTRRQFPTRAASRVSAS